MARKVYRQGNALIIENDAGVVVFSPHAINVLVQPVENDPTTFMFWIPNIYVDPTRMIEITRIGIADLVDADAVAYSVESFIEFYTKNTGKFEPLDYNTELGKGNILGEESIPINAFSGNLTNGGYVDIWSETANLVEQATAVAWEIVSSDPNDALAGTGAQKVTIRTISDTYVEQIEEVDMNGVTPVALAGTHFRVGYNCLNVTLSGSTGSNVGKIELRPVIRSLEIQSTILAVVGKSFNAHFTVPANKYFLRTNIGFSVGKGDDAIVQSAIFDVDTNTRTTQGVTRIYQNNIAVPIVTPVRVEPKQTVKYQAISTATAPSSSITMLSQYTIIDL